MKPGSATAANSASLDCERLLDAARKRAGLVDFGDRWFFEPMDRFIAAANTEACLTPAGAAAQAEVIVKGLTSRLRMIEDLKRHPEIHEEQVSVAAVILGLPRTGSTLFQRLLASAPGMTAIRWYEAQNVAPFPDEVPGKPVERRAYARRMIADWLAAAPELASIHPLDADAPDEEILVLGQMFVSTMIEGMTFVPSFARWLDGYDQSRGHADLKTILQYLQWQDPLRRGRRWVLKSPSNLPYVRYAATAFPEAALIMTHRDPLETVPSYVSMQATLYRLTAHVDERDVADFWVRRLAQWMTAFEAQRAAIGEARFIDIDYRDVIRAPLEQAMRVIRLLDIAAGADTEAALRDFLAGNAREQRPAHNYSLDGFGLNSAAIEGGFSDYRSRYIVTDAEQAHGAA